MKPIKKSLLTAAISVITAFAAFGQNRNDSLSITDQLVPIDHLYRVNGPTEKNDTLSISYTRWSNPQDLYTDYLTLKGKDGFRGEKDSLFGQDDITSFHYIKTTKDGKTTIIRGKAAENGFNITTLSGDGTSKPVSSHAKRLNNLGFIRTVLPHLE